MFLDNLMRIDGKKMSEDDHNFLIEYRGFQLALNFLLAAKRVLNKAPFGLGLFPTNDDDMTFVSDQLDDKYASDVDDDLLPYGAYLKTFQFWCYLSNLTESEDIARKVGDPTLDEADEFFLLQYHGYHLIFRLLQDVYTQVTQLPFCFGLYPEYDESMDETLSTSCKSHDEALIPYGAFVWLFYLWNTSCNFIAGLSAIDRRDGEMMTEDDEHLLLEYKGFQVCVEVGLRFYTSISEVSNRLDLWQTDSELAAVGERLAEVHSTPISEEEGLVPYGAYKWIIMLFRSILTKIYEKLLGDLTNIQNSKSANTLKRTPSGAELNATLGFKLRAAVGLDNPARKVRVRGLL